MIRRALVAAFLVSCAVAQAEAPAIVVRSLQPFLPPSLQAPGGPISALERQRSDEPRGLEVGSEPEAPDWVAMVLADRHRAAIDAGKLEIDQGMNDPRKEGKVVTHPYLVLRGEQEAVAACAHDFDALANAATRPIEITVWRLPPAGNTLPSAVWSAAELRDAVAARPPLWTARACTRSGGAVRLAAEQWHGFVQDLGVEIAEKQRIFDPYVDQAFTGLRAALTAHELPGDGIVLQGQWLLSDQVSVQEQPVGENQPSVDLREHATAFATFGGRIESGGALVVSGRGGAVGPADFVLVASARFLAASAAEPAPDLFVRPVGALLFAPSLPPDVFTPFGFRGDDIAQFPSPRTDAGLSPVDLGHCLGADEARTHQLAHGIVAIHGSGDVCRRAADTLHTLAARLETVCLRSEVRGDVGTAGLQLVQPALCGRTVAAFVGRERSIIRDLEVEIFQQLHGPKPIMGIVGSGLWVRCRVEEGPLPHRATGLWLVAAHDPPALRHVRGELPMTLHLASYRTAAFPWDGPVPLDQELALGDGPAWTANGAATRIVIGLTKP